MIFESSAPLRLILLGLLVASSPLLAQQRGYQSRPVGLDMNDNGIIGEAADALVCDGTSGTGISVEDVDGDGVGEEQIYVDCDSGTDSSTCGGPSNPCRTITYAWSQRADGPGDGAEDIVCFTGTCTPNNAIRPGRSGVAGYSVSTASGSEERDWRYPTDPSMLVGWDRDNDDRYPPFDSDDNSVLDDADNELAFLSSENDYIELAHFEARDFGGNNSGFWSCTSTNGSDVLYHYYHDIELQNINRGVAADSGVIAFSFFCSDQVISWLSIENILMNDFGGYGFRGDLGRPPSPESGPFRFQNITGRAHGHPTDSDGVSGWKLWGLISDVEILDNEFYSDPSEYLTTSNNVQFWAAVAQCSQDFTIRNNYAENFFNTIIIQPDAGSSACQSRPLENIVFDRNEIVLAQDQHYWYPSFARIEGGSGSAYPGTISFTNNVFSSSHSNTTHIGIDWQGGTVGNPVATWANNTFFFQTPDTLPFKISSGSTNSWRFYNNVFTGASGGVDVRFSPSDWQADNNVYHSSSTWNWGSNWTTSLATWRSWSGGDGSAASCNTALINPPADNHLSGSDTCAVGSAVDLSSSIPDTQYDIDGDFRSGLWDSGADQLQSGPSPPNVTITLPASGGTHPSGSPINFAGTAFDSLDGDITSSLVWASSLDGNIGTGGSFAAALSVGSHLVTASVTNSSGLDDDETISLTVENAGNAPPQVTINSPIDEPAECSLALDRPVTASATSYPNAEEFRVVDGDTDLPLAFWAAPGSPNWVEVDLGEYVALDHLEIDPFAGNPGSTYYYDDSWRLQYRNAGGQWTDFTGVSKLAGAGDLVGPGVRIDNGRPSPPGVNDDAFKYYRFDVVPVGADAIRFEVLTGDQDGDSNASEITVCSPKNLRSEGSIVILQASALDPEEGDIASTLVWESDLAGVLGTGPQIQVALSPGAHTITATATDTEPQTGSDSIEITVFSPDMIMQDGFESGSFDNWD